MLTDITHRRRVAALRTLVVNSLNTFDFIIGAFVFEQPLPRIGLQFVDVDITTSINDRPSINCQIGTLSIVVGVKPLSGAIFFLFNGGNRQQPRQVEDR